MDVQTPELGPSRDRADAPPPAWWLPVLAAVLFLGILLRLHGIHNPMLDHPGWRQGDTASIARNFALLQFDIMHPQTTYNGLPPHYVELELQIVPFAAATLYKIFGVHPVFGRFLSLGCSLLTIVTLAFFGRWLFYSAAAGMLAAAVFAVLPGSVYYGRTFMPDTAMVFFLTAALYAAARLLLEGAALKPRTLARTTALLTLAYLAKPVAVLAIVPIAALLWQRLRAGIATRPTAAAVLLFVPLLVLWLYDRQVRSYAEWHWASGITTLHVLPSLRTALSSPSGLIAKVYAFRSALGLFRQTMVGSVALAMSIAGFAALPWIAARSRLLLWTWLAASLAYVFVVVTVEHVDYYMYPLLPLCALVVGGAAAGLLRAAARSSTAPAARYGIYAFVGLLGIVVLLQGRAAVAGYYAYNTVAYRNAIALDASLPKGALVVLGHYGPDVQYYVNRFGWEEDPLLWTPFDEESAIAKGARYFIAIEDRRLRRNEELCAWLQRFPVRNAAADWIVYETDPAKMRPNADAWWRAFRAAERHHHGRAFLDRTPLCRLKHGV